MKQVLALLLITCGMIACENNSTSTETKEAVKEETHLVGNDSDEHGCKASAGYTWSVVKNDCIRIWETGIQLTPVEKQDGHVSNASVIFSDDKTKAELFIANEKGSLLLTPEDASNSLYKGGVYTLSQTGKGWQLKKSGQLIYTEASK